VLVPCTNLTFDECIQLIYGPRFLNIFEHFTPRSRRHRLISVVITLLQVVLPHSANPDLSIIFTFSPFPRLIRVIILLLQGIDVCCTVIFVAWWHILWTCGRRLYDNVEPILGYRSIHSKLTSATCPHAFL